MEDDIDYGKNMTLEELKNLEEADIEFDKNAEHVEDGKCPHCNERFVKVVESKNVGDWVTFHITKLKCTKCGEVYLDLKQGKKNDIIFMLERAFKQPVDVLSKKVEKLI